MKPVPMETEYVRGRNALIRYAVARADSEPGLDDEEWNRVFLAAMTHLCAEAGLTPWRDQ